MPFDLFSTRTWANETGYLLSSVTIPLIVTLFCALIVMNGICRYSNNKNLIPNLSIIILIFYYITIYSN